MTGLVKRRLRSKRGQSILEYLVIATIIVGAILVIAKPALTTNINGMYTAAAAKTAAATAKMVAPIGE